MGIKMRQNKNQHVNCKVCGNKLEESLGMFDIAFTDKHIITICDRCNNQLLSKSLKASCLIDSKIKSKKDQDIIAMRKGRNKY